MNTLVWFVFLLSVFSPTMSNRLNVLNGDLELCSTDPLTGFMRNGYCETNEHDYGTHLVCATVTDEFLRFTKAQGNDLSTPHPPSFPGLKHGDNWCLCVSRWAQAYKSGIRMNLVLPATHRNTLDYLRRFNLTLDDLQNHSNPPNISSGINQSKTDL